MTPWSRSNPQKHVLGDEIMAAALIDRHLHHCHIVDIRGNSYRMWNHQHWLRSASEQRREGPHRDHRYNLPEQEAAFDEVDEFDLRGHGPGPLPSRL